MPDGPCWFVGVDWASAAHHATLLDARGAVLGERAVAHGGAGLGELCDWLLGRTGAEAGAIAVAIEVPHGPVVEALLGRTRAMQGWLEVAQRCGCATPAECALFDAPERGSGDPVLALRVVRVGGSDCRRPG